MCLRFFKICFLFAAYGSEQQGGCVMQWYVLQTRTGEEEKLVEMIRRIVPHPLYGECFVIYHAGKESLSRVCVYYIQGAGGFIFLPEKTSDHGKNDGA